MLLLDTCALVFDALTPHRLSKTASAAIEAAAVGETLVCSDISLWEVAMLVERRRLDPGVDTASFLRLALAARGVRVLPITPEIAARSAALLMHGDPADRIIAATALVHGLSLVSSDRRLRELGDLEVIW